ncbi:hypothetical protein ON010_g8845 [Phytophthora cinnamomi]|nr:hypothetical protein ON010_g8845 [Phytophthora cinnamomi]
MVFYFTSSGKLDRREQEEECLCLLHEVAKFEEDTIHGGWPSGLSPPRASSALQGRREKQGHHQDAQQDEAGVPSRPGRYIVALVAEGARELLYKAERKKQRLQLEADQRKSKLEYKQQKELRSYSSLMSRDNIDAGDKLEAAADLSSVNAYEEDFM